MLQLFEKMERKLKMSELKEKKYFTDEYYEVLKKIKEQANEKKSDYKTFRESDGDARYQSIAVEITQENSCQLSCKWCYINQTNRKIINHPVSFEVIKDIIDRIKAYNHENHVKLFSNIVLIGGEPTLNKDLEKMIDYAIQNDLTPMVVTNALKFSDRAYAESICKEGVVVIFHLPFMKENEKYDVVLDEYCKAPGYSKKLRKSIKNMIEIREKVKDLKLIGEIVLNKATVDYVYESYVYCRENNIEPYFEFMRIADEDNLNDDIKLPQKALIAFSEKVYQYDLEHGFVEKDNIVAKVRYFLPPAVNKPCTIIQNSIHIKFTKEGFGNVVSCSGQDIVHGNIVTDSLEKIINDKENNPIFSKQEEFIKGPCSICGLYFITGCQGGCRGNSKNTYDCPEASDPQCIFIRDEVKKDAALMCMRLEQE